MLLSLSGAALAQEGADIFAELTEDLALTDEQMALYTAHKDAARS